MPPSNWYLATTAADGYVSCAAWRSPLVLTSRPAPDSTRATQQRLVQLGGGGEVRGSHVGMEVALDEVEVAERVEELGADRTPDFVEVRRDDLRERAARDPRVDARRVVRRVRVDVDAADDVVVAVPSEVIADLGLVAAVVGDLDAEPDRDAARAPALGGLADDPLAGRERDEVEGRCARFEVDVIGDRDLGDPPLDGLRRVDVDRDVAVRREVRVEVAVERQVSSPGRSGPAAVTRR